MGRTFMRRLAYSTAVALLAGLLSSSSLLAQGAAGPAGHWTGSVDAMGHALGFEIDFVRADSGWSGKISIPEQGATDLPLSDIAVKGDSVVFAIAGVMGAPTFRGTLQNGGQTLAGAFTQGATNTTFTMSRGAAPGDKAAPPAGAEPARPSVTASPIKK